MTAAGNYQVMPPLSAEEYEGAQPTLAYRLHWSDRHRRTAQIRGTVGWLARAAGIPAAEHAPPARADGIEQ